MKNILLIILNILCIITITIFIVFNKETNEDINFKLNGDSTIDYKISKNKIVRKYTFNNLDILNMEKDDLEKKNYKVTVNDLEMIATKSGNIKCKK